MSFEHFLSRTDGVRLDRVLQKLQLCGLTEFAITGSLALEVNLILLGCAAQVRTLHDLDIVVESFDSIPHGIARCGLLCRHIHPRAPEGKIVIQLVDPDESLRIDVFRPYGATLQRVNTTKFGTRDVLVVSVEDLAARTACLLLGMQTGATVLSKHAEAFRRLAPVLAEREMGKVWPEHRKKTDPLTFKDAAARIRGLVQSRGDLLVAQEYSQDVHAVCSSCAEVGPFRLASAVRVREILGYC